MVDALGPGIEVLKASEIARFKETVARGDGEPIVLNSETIGKSLFLFSNVYNFPFEQFGEDARLLTQRDQVLLFSIHETPVHVSEPVGYLDIEVNGENAKRYSWHESMGEINESILSSIKKNEEGKLVVSNWFGWPSLAFWTRKEYRGEKLGSLLISSALIALKSRGVKTLTAGGCMTDTAKITWEKFGIQSNMHRERVPVDDLVNHPRVDQSIARFV